MSKHTFTIEVKVDDEALAEHNRRAEKDKDRTFYPDDPSEWGDNDLTYALNDELATLEIIDYSAIVEPQEAVDIDRAAREA